MYVSFMIFFQILFYKKKSGLTMNLNALMYFKLFIVFNFLSDHLIFQNFIKYNPHVMYYVLK